MKQLIEVMERFLTWSRKMKAKPSKCVSLGMKVIDGRYVSFDPEILIDGAQIQFIGNTPMKFLGSFLATALDIC